MNILVLNSGSSSLKFQLITLPSEKVICQGLAERIGLDTGIFRYTTATEEVREEISFPSHREALETTVHYMTSSRYAVVPDREDIKLVGHRVVHGGDTFARTVRITEEVKQKIKELTTLAPLHNPANLQGIEVAEQLFPEAVQVAVFDTSFHQTIPEFAFRYAIPNMYYDKYKIRVYGFHGTSHKYVSETLLKKHSIHNLITIHLGNGCSMAAIKDGKCMDTSLGFAPMNGLIMGTRCGDIDPSVILYLMDTLHMEKESVFAMLQKESGMLGLTGHSDMRDIEAGAKEGDPRCQLALQMNVYRIKKYIGSYAAAMNGLDAIIFTAGIGENSSTIRQMVCSEMDYFGILLDEEKNQQRFETTATIHRSDSRTKLFVIPTNEELEIAKQAYSLIHE